MTTGFVVIGECVADIVRTPQGPDQAHPGGSPANVAFGLARLDHPAGLVTELGDDGYGRMIADHLRGAGVLLSAGDGNTRTPSAVVGLDAEGRASYSFDIAWNLPQARFPQGLAPRHIHTGSIAAVTEPGAAAVWAAVESSRGGASVSYDPNVRPALLGERREAVARVERGVALSDVVKASDEDMEWLYPDRSADEVASRWLGLGAALVLLTRGPDGAVAYRDGRRREVDAEPVEVVDTVGAGDAFMSGALHALEELDVLGAEAAARLTALGDGQLDEVLRCATASAALTVTVAGALPPTATRLRAARAHSGPR